MVLTSGISESSRKPAQVHQCCSRLLISALVLVCPSTAARQADLSAIWVSLGEAAHELGRHASYTHCDIFPDTSLLRDYSIPACGADLAQEQH